MLSIQKLTIKNLLHLQECFMWLFKRIWNQESFGNGIPNWIGRRRFRSDGSGIGGGDASSQSGGMSGNLLVTSESENINVYLVM